MPAQRRPEVSGTAPRSLVAFLGHWSMARDIRHADGLEGRLDGTARFTRSGPGRLTCDEDGWLTLGAAAPLHATSRTLWRAAPGAIEVAFADGRPFHRIALGAGRPETVHLCPPDRYAVTYDFTGWPLWSARWRVEGPRKNYEMTTRYAPLR